MTPPSTLPRMVAVDIGNTRMKLALFTGDVDASYASSRTLPVPRSVLAIEKGQSFEAVRSWLHHIRPAELPWYVASVERTESSRLLEWLAQEAAVGETTLLAPQDLPLEVALEHPQRVGMDRLCAAVAANRLRSPNRAAIIADLGTALTVNLVSASGSFCGGAILPGLQTAGRALHMMTDLLPLVRASDWTAPPPALGTNTTAAIESGLFWGAVGAIRELSTRLTTDPALPAELFLTGGSASLVSQVFGQQAAVVPHLTLSGIAVAAAHSMRTACTESSSPARP